MIFWPIIKYDRDMLFAIMLVSINLLALFVGAMVGEYEFSKALHPLSNWFTTPPIFDWTMTSLLILTSIINLTVLVFVLYRRLIHHLSWLRWATLFGIILVAVTWLVLGQRFLPILWTTL